MVMTVVDIHRVPAVRTPDMVVTSFIPRMTLRWAVVVLLTVERVTDKSEMP